MPSGRKRLTSLLWQSLLILVRPCPAWMFCVGGATKKLGPLGVKSRFLNQLASSRAEPPPSLATPAPTPTTSKYFYTPLPLKSEHAIDLSLMRDLAMGQVGLWAMVSVLFVWQRLPALQSLSIFPSSPWQIDSGLAVLTVGLLLATDASLDKVAPSTACRLEFSTTNLVTTLWGRRFHEQPVGMSTNATTSKDALCTALALAAVTALCQQAIFFDLIPGAIMFATHSVPMAVMLPPLFFGAFQTILKVEDYSLLVPLHVLHGIIYAALIASTGAWWPSVLAQTLYQTHTWTKSWHSVNDQVDWAHRAPAQPPFSTHDVVVWTALQSHSQGALTPDSIQVLRSIFYAFDTGRRGRLSLQNAQKAIAYTFWQQNEDLPDPDRVQVLFEALLDQRPDTQDAPVDQLSWVEFVRLLISVRASTRAES